NIATGIITTFAGDGLGACVPSSCPGKFAGDGGPAILAAFDRPRGIAVDARGNVFILDAGNGRIRRIDHQTGIISTVAGNGIPGFSGDAGPATAASIGQFEAGIGFDANGDLYIADGDARVRKVNLATGLISTVAGTGVQASSGDNGLA